jgi:hypothetical protein
MVAEVLAWAREIAQVESPGRKGQIVINFSGESVRSELRLFSE